MGLRVLRVTPELVQHLLVNGTRCARPIDCPADLEVLEVRFDVTKRDTIDLIVRSAQWEDLPLRPIAPGRAAGWVGDRLEPVEIRFAMTV
jgi:hypothetical protein